MKQIITFSILIQGFLAFSEQLVAQLPEGFVQIQVATNLDPTAMAIAPDGRIFITEKNGKLRIVKNDQLLPDPFLTIPVDNYNERGLGGVVLDPDFERNGYVYVFFTVPGQNFNRISRFTANGDYAIPNSEKVILDLDPLAGTIHNGGAMLFGNDGKLYVSVGDGSDANNAQRLDRLSGKILRINPDGSIPEDNPFFNQTTGKYRAIWALGLRNSFTFAKQGTTGRIFANDVGNQAFEEVNEIVKGGNYGWNLIEGYREGQNPPANYKEPVYAYSHAEGCCAIGAAFYNPEIATFPQEYVGKYFFADYCAGYMKVLNPDNGTIEATFITDLNQPVGILTAPDGNLYYLARAGIGGGSIEDNTSTNNGSLWKVTYTGSGAPFIAVQPASVTIPIGEDATFAVLAIGKAPLRYQWEKNGAAISGATSPTFTFANAALSDDGTIFTCLITNEQGVVASSDAVLHVTPNTRPLPRFIFPDEGTSYAAGDTIFFEGSASDAEDGMLSAEQLGWRVDFHHDDHTHPALDPTEGISKGFLVVPRFGELSDNVFFRIHFTANDKGGLSKTIFRDVLPQKTQFTITSEPTGLEINIDGKIVTTPFVVTSVEGIRRIAIAIDNQFVNNELYAFDRWSDDSTDPIYTFLAGEKNVITARFKKVTLAIGNGTGLLGNYYEGMRDAAFETVPELVRVDTVVNFDWALGAPGLGLPADFFAVRWEGRVQPPLSGKYFFHAVGDDGVRLWVDDQLIVNQWIPQEATEVTGSIDLEGGKKYKIRFEFFEDGGLAVARLLWSTDKLPKQIIPKSQLFPMSAPTIPRGESYATRLSPNPANNLLNLEIGSKIFDKITWLIFDAQGKEMGRGVGNVSPGANVFELDITNLASGAYFIKVNGRSIIDTQEKFIKH